MQSTESAPRAFLPSDIPADRILIRAITAHAVAAARGHGTLPATISKTFWPRDAGTYAMVTRGATTPATIGGSGWADTVAARATAEFVGALQDSAAAQLIAAAPRFDLPGYATVVLPRASTTGSPQWIAEGSAMPVAQGVVTGPVLGPPKKLGIIETCTRELSEASPQGAEEIIAIILRDAVSRALDAGIFSATAGDATRPAGILSGIAGLTATTGGGVNAMLTDLRLLVDAVTAGGGSTSGPMFFTSPGRALSITAYSPAMVGRVFGSAAIAGTVLICLDQNAFCSMFGSEPDNLLVSKETTVHFEDTAPLQLTTGAQGSGVVATPARSAWQQDLIVVRLVLRCAWIMRVPGAVAHISTGLSW